MKWWHELGLLWQLAVLAVALSVPGVVIFTSMKLLLSLLGCFAVVCAWHWLVRQIGWRWD